MTGFFAVTPSGTKGFKTPFAAMNYIIKLGTAGTVEAVAPDGERVPLWKRAANGEIEEL